MQVIAGGMMSSVQRLPLFSFVLMIVLALASLALSWCAKNTFHSQCWPLVPSVGVLFAIHWLRANRRWYFAFHPKSVYFYFHWCLYFSLYSYTHLTLFNTATTLTLLLLHCYYICTLNLSHHLTFRSLSSWPRMSLPINGRLMTPRHDHFMTKCAGS